MRLWPLVSVLCLAGMALAQYDSPANIVPRGGIKNPASAEDMAKSEVPIEFRGFRPGMSAGQFNAAYEERMASKPALPRYIRREDVYGQLRCSSPSSGLTRCDNVQEGLWAEFLDGVLARMDWIIPHSNFDDIRQGLISKYGKPSSTEIEKLQNRMGANFEGLDATWRTDRAALYVREYVGSIDDSFVEVRDQRASDEFDARAPKRKPDI